MTINRIAYLTMAVTGLLYASGLRFAQTATTTPPHVPLQKAIGQAKDAKPEVVPSLIVLNARGASLQGQKLTLVGVAQNSIVFADRPVRSAGHVLTAHLLEEWGTGSDSFAKDPPNATVSVFSKDGSAIRDAVVVLKTPNLQGDQLTFDVQVLEGDLAGADGPASVFIDIIGMPWTPLSFAGVARRTAARAAWYGTRRQPRRTIIRTTRRPRLRIIAPLAGITLTHRVISWASYRQLGHNDCQNCFQCWKHHTSRAALPEHIDRNPEHRPGPVAPGPRASMI